MSDDRDYEDEYEDYEPYDNSPSKVYANEYTSILSAFFRNAIKPVFKNKPIIRELLEDTIAELDCKISSKGFQSLTFRLRNAYLSFRNFTEILNKSDDNEIKYQSEILEGLFLLAEKCYSAEDEISVAGGRNPCRDKQYNAKAQINIVEENLGKTRLSESARTMLDICRLCPHR